VNASFGEASGKAPDIEVDYLRVVQESASGPFEPVLPQDEHIRPLRMA
jgi:hypothetical protein